jgi:hypothetical protein
MLLMPRGGLAILRGRIFRTGPIRRSGAPRHHDLFLFLGQLDLWKFSVCTGALALYNSYLPFFLSQQFFWGPLEKISHQNLGSQSASGWHHCKKPSLNSQKTLKKPLKNSQKTHKKLSKIPQKTVKKLSKNTKKSTKNPHKNPPARKTKSNFVLQKY